MAQPLDGPVISEMCTLAKELCVWLSLGGFHEKVTAGAVISQIWFP